jgi:hypothetical protein
MSAVEHLPLLLQVQQEFAALIEAGAFRIRDATPKPTANDGAIVVLESDALLLRLVRDRGHVDIEVGIPTDPSRTYPLSTIVRAIGLGESSGGGSLPSLADELAWNFQQLRDAATQEAWPETRARCEALNASDRNHFVEYAKWLETSGYTERAAKATRNWQRRWLLKAALLLVGAFILFYGYSADVPELKWWGIVTIVVSILVPGKHWGKPLPPMPNTHKQRDAR